MPLQALVLVGVGGGCTAGCSPCLEAEGGLPGRPDQRRAPVPCDGHAGAGAAPVTEEEAAANKLRWEESGAGEGSVDEWRWTLNWDALPEHPIIIGSCPRSPEDIVSTWVSRGSLEPDVAWGTTCRRPSPDTGGVAGAQAPALPSPAPATGDPLEKRSRIAAIQRFLCFP